VVVESLLGVFDVTSVGQILLCFRGRLRQPLTHGEEDRRFAAGEEVTEVKWFNEKDVPWSDLAFPTTRLALEIFFDDPTSTASHYRVVTQGIPRS
jgi:hypothetical protein